MPAPKKLGSSVTFEDTKTVSKKADEKNDCAVIATALTTQKPYDEVHALFKAEGREAQKYTPLKMIREVHKRLGFKLTEIPQDRFISKYPGRHVNLQTITTHHMERFHEVWADGNTYLLLNPDHTLAVIDGHNHDHTRGRKVKVTLVYKVTAI